MNAPQTVIITGTNTYTPPAWSCPATITSAPASQTSYTLTSPGLCSYDLNLQAVSGYNTTPNDYPITISCNSVTGPTFWYNRGAGAITQNVTGQLSPLYYGSGGASQSGPVPGYHLENYTNSAPLSTVTYSAMLANVFHNSGLPSSQNPCLSAGGRYDWANYTFFCYDGRNSSGLQSALQTAITSGQASPKINVLYPDPANAVGTLVQQIISQSVPASGSLTNRTIIAFVNSSLQVQANITVNSSLGSGLVFSLNNPDAANPAAAGNLLVDSPVTELDGVYVFPGFFSDTQGGGNSGIKLTGYGSLLAIGNQALNLNRTADMATGPAEDWHFQPKYLTMYQNVLSSPRFIWQELTPQ